MRRCLRCSNEFTSPDWQCPSCGWQPDAHGPFPLFAPKLVGDEAGYDPSLFASLAKLESDSFWFRGRNALLVWALRKHAPGAASFMEIGCGNGFVLQGVGRASPALRLTGADGSAEGLAFAADRLPQAEFMQVDARDIPFAAEFDVVGAFDVIEHIEEDEVALGQLCNALKPGGLLMLTVPQHPSLWSKVDEKARHVRRYRSRELKEKVERSGLEPIYTTSFVTALLPVMWLSRRLKRGERGAESDALEELRMNPALNTVFEWCLRGELWLIRLGLSFPIGGSRLLLAKRADPGMCT